MNLLGHPGDPSLAFESDELSRFLPENSPRYRHILGVARCMEEVFPRLDLPRSWKEELVTACLLHDIGYAPELAGHRFHPLDGAVFARERGFSKSVVATVLFHSCADDQARLTRPNLYPVYLKNASRLNQRDRLFIDLVTYCDLHTSPVGERFTLDERVREVVDRYGPDHPVSRFMVKHRPVYEETIRRVNGLFVR
ncbi:HD domain-containing protein [Staphylospora marina]|uniref:HD domain-containing protein n=1 Tax=Staphylospora marina TaxID=2490858 RepID=UPI000F5BA5E3|nr:HD domain-containing protein [Staphylospora marina]